MAFFRCDVQHRNRIEFQHFCFSSPFVAGSLETVRFRMFAFRAIVSGSMLMHSIASTCGHVRPISISRGAHADATTERNGYILRDRMHWTHVTNTVVFNSLNKRSIYSSNILQQQRRRRRRHRRRRSFASRAILDFFRGFLFSFPFSDDDRVQSNGRGRCSSCSAVDSLLIAGKYISFSNFPFHRAWNRSWRARCAKQGDFRDDKEPAAAAYSHVIGQSPAEAETTTHINMRASIRPSLYSMVPQRGH